MATSKAELNRKIQAEHALHPPRAGRREVWLDLKPQRFKWTREQYHKMTEAGLFVGTRVELLEGEIFDMSAVYAPHATSVTLTSDLLREAFGKGWVIRVQQPLSLSERSEPEPDVAVVAGKPRDFKQAHPGSAALVIEVADSSLKYDRESKASLYAKAGLADYWIVNVLDRQVEVHRRPGADNNAEFGYSYADKMTFRESETIAPLAKPKVKITVADLLP
jgi:Uma2 family endonuclease